MPKTISRDVPLAELTLRRYEKAYSMPRRELIRKLCLSLGLLQPGDSRDIMVDVLQVLLASAKKKKALSSEGIQKETIALRKRGKLPLKGIAPSNIRRQIKRLKDIYLVEKINNNYRITEFEKVGTLFEEKIEKMYLPSIIQRVKEYCKALE